MVDKAELIALAERVEWLGVSVAKRAVAVNQIDGDWGEDNAGGFGQHFVQQATEWLALAAALRARADGGE